MAILYYDDIKKGGDSSAGGIIKVPTISSGTYKHLRKKPQK